MSRHTPIVIALLAVLVAMSLAPPAQAVPGICLSRNPAPPSGAANDGTGNIRFDWTIETGAGITCSTPYTFEILDTNMNVLPGFPVNFACPGVNPFSNFYVWNIPAGLACGCYYGRVTFYSNWCNGTLRKIEDQALTAVIVTGGATFRICKFRDINGDGIKDPTDPPIQGWHFIVTGPFGSVECITGEDGCCTINIAVNCVGSTQLTITDVLPPGWQQTTQGGVSPFPVNVVSGPNPDILVGNWQPVVICGNKWIDQAPWPWQNPHYVGPNGQQNPPEWEPVPDCAVQNPPNPCTSPTQPDPIGIPGVTVQLYDNTDPMNPVLVATTVTGENGAFCFGPLQWRQEFEIVMGDPDPVPPECNPPLDDIAAPLGPLSPWPGGYLHTVATSVWPCPNISFDPANILEITLPQPTVVGQIYGCNYFYNRQPSRLIGQFCEEAITLLPNIALGVGHESLAYPVPAVNVQADGSYIIPEIQVVGQPAEGGIRPGTYQLTPPALPANSGLAWIVTTYCDSINGNSTFPLPASGVVNVGVGHSSDVRVDFCLSPPNERQCFIPVTFTQQGWRDFCDPANTVINGGMVYNRFPIAFANFTYFGTLYHNLVIIGQGKTMTWEGTSVGLKRLCLFLPQNGPCGKLNANYLNAWTLPNGVGGRLAGELLALQLNIAYNDRRLMPRTLGYDLELFKLASSIFKGKTVREVRNIANAVLGGASPASYGLTGCDQLADILAAINANYEFVNYNVFNDRGFLIPNRQFGQPDPAVPVVVP